MKNSTLRLFLVTCIFFTASHSFAQFKFGDKSTVGQTLVQDGPTGASVLSTTFNTDKGPSSAVLDGATYTISISKCQTNKGIQVNVYDDSVTPAAVVNGDFKCRNYGSYENPPRVESVASLQAILDAYAVNDPATTTSKTLPAHCLFDIAGDNQAFGAYPGKYKRVEYGFYYSFSGYSVTQDITFDIDTYHAGTGLNGATASYELTVYVGGTAEGNLVGTVPGFYVSGSGLKSVSLAGAINADPSVFSNQKVYFFLKTAGSGTAIADDVMDPIIVFDNMVARYNAAAWVMPPAGAIANTTLDNANSPLIGTLDVESTLGVHLQTKGRLGKLIIVNDLQDNTRQLFTFPDALGIKANDGNGNYTVDVPYAITPAVFNEGNLTWSKAKIEIAAPVAGSVDDDVMFYFKATPKTQNAVSSRLELDCGTRIWYDVYFKGVEGPVVDLTGIANADTLAHVLPTVADGTTIILDGNMTYNTGGFAFDKSVEIVSIDPAQMAKINCGSNFNVAEGANIGSIIFKNVTFFGDFAANYVFNIDKSATVGEIRFQSCNVNSLRGVIRMKGGTGVLDKYTISDCLVDSINGYGVLSVDVNTWMCSNILFENSTFSKTQYFLVSKNNTNSLTIDHCTINEAPEKGRQMFRWREAGKDAVANVTISNSIIGHGWNMSGGTDYAIDGFDGMTGAVWTVTNSYATNDFMIGATKDPIPNFPTTTYNGSATDLWVDPANSDFNFKDTFFAGIDNAGDPRWYGTPYVAKKVAYVTFDKTMDATAASPAEDPIIKMLQADLHFDVNVMVVAADSVFSLDGYDVVVAQEGFSSSAAIYKPGGSLALEKIKVPFVYNKAYALKDGKAISSATAAPSEIAGELYMQVPAASQSSMLFSGITFETEDIMLFKTGAADNGSNSANKAYSFATDVEMSDATTLLAKTKGAVGNVSVCINDIPAGTILGTQDTLKARMIAISENFGAICKDHGTNLTDEGLTIWRNAVYMAAGIDVPTTLIKNSSALDTLYASVGTLSPVFDPAQTSYQLYLPTGTTSVSLTAVASSDQATLTVPDAITVTEGKDSTVTVVVTNALGNDSVTYEVMIHVIGTGVSQLDRMNVSVYPNPATDYAKVHFTLAEPQEVSLSLYNMVGQRISITGNKRFSTGGNEIRINTQGLRDGLYFYSLKVGSKVTSGKLYVTQ